MMISKPFLICSEAVLDNSLGLFRCANNTPKIAAHGGSCRIHVIMSTD
jgi:hypothetical protein